MKRRIIQKTIRFTQEEYEALCERIASKQKSIRGEDSFSAYARECLLAKSQYRSLRIEREISDLRYEIRKIGVNINQVTKKINGGYGTQMDLITLKKRLEDIEKLVDSYEKKVEEFWRSQSC